MAFVVLLKVLENRFPCPHSRGASSNKASRAYLHTRELVTVFLRSLNSRENNVGAGNPIHERGPYGSHRNHCSCDMILGFEGCVYNTSLRLGCFRSGNDGKVNTGRQRNRNVTSNNPLV